VISAIVLAAGLSKRMGTPKMVLPWGNVTVIEQVLSVLVQAKIVEILVVTGGAHQEVKAAVRSYPVRVIFNPHFFDGQMIRSVQIGLSHLAENCDAAMIVLGDQPQIQKEIVEKITDVFRRTKAPIVVPSYNLRRGHPWILARELWDEVMNLKKGGTLRQILELHSKNIEYLQVNTDTILMDLDTPSDYQSQKPDGFSSANSQ